jgi:hypothetical protein
MGVDVETFSGTDIKNGAYAHADAPDFEIILVAYKIGDGPVKQFMPRRFAERPGVLGIDLSAQGEQMELFGKTDLLKELCADGEILDGNEDEFLQALNDPTIIKNGLQTQTLNAQP